jgi:hypothetical protein
VVTPVLNPGNSDEGRYLEIHHKARTWVKKQEQLMAKRASDGQFSKLVYIEGADEGVNTQVDNSAVSPGFV